MSTDWGALVTAVMSLLTAVVGYWRNRRTGKAAVKAVQTVQTTTDYHGVLLKHLMNGQYPTAVQE